MQQLERAIIAWIQQAYELSLGKTGSTHLTLQSHLQGLSRLQQDLQQDELAAQAHCTSVHGQSTVEVSACIATLQVLSHLKAHGSLDNGMEDALADCQQQFSQSLGASNAAALIATFSTLHAAWAIKVQELPLRSSVADSMIASHVRLLEPAPILGCSSSALMPCTELECC